MQNSDPMEGSGPAREDRGLSADERMAGVLAACALAALLFAGGCSSSGPTRFSPEMPEEPYRIVDDGEERAYVLARDHVAVRGADGEVRLQSVIGAASPEVVRTLAASMARDASEEVYLVLYEQGESRSAASRRLLTRDVLVELESRRSISKVLSETGGTLMDATGLELSERQYLVRADRVGGSLSLAAALRARDDVATAEPVLAKR